MVASELANYLDSLHKLALRKIYSSVRHALLVGRCRFENIYYWKHLKNSKKHISAASGSHGN